MAWQEPLCATTEAMAMRAQWMRQMGLDEDEIAEYCNEAKYPANTADEQKELEAMARLIASEREIANALEGRRVTAQDHTRPYRLGDDP